MKFNFSNNRTIFPAVMYYLQTSPDSGSSHPPSPLPLHVGKVKQIHTHRGSSDKSVFLHNTPSVKFTPCSPPYFIKKMLQKNISPVITVVIFTYTGVLCSSILVLVCSQKWSLVWYTLKHGVAHIHVLHSQHLYFVLVSLLFGVMYTVPNSLTLHDSVFVLSWVKLFKLAQGWGVSSSVCFALS